MTSMLYSKVGASLQSQRCGEQAHRAKTSCDQDAGSSDQAHRDAFDATLKVGTCAHVLWSCTLLYVCKHVREFVGVMVHMHMHAHVC